VLPQSVYPTDLRDSTIAHLGGDLYGDISLRHGLGDLTYTVYGGHRSDSIYSGYPYLLSQFGTHFKTFGGLQYGGDLRWQTPLRGLLVGASRMNENITGKGMSKSPMDLSAVIPYTESSKADWTNQFYGEYTFAKLRIDAEYRRYLRDQIVLVTSTNLTDVRGWYISGSFRVNKRLELGSYYSRYAITSVYGGFLATIGPNSTDTSLPANHIDDKVISARIELKKFWNAKIEGHFMDGYGSSIYPDGFYPQVNPAGFRPNTNALVLKTSVNF
jgi:hypothetical protein